MLAFLQLITRLLTHGEWNETAQIPKTLNILCKSHIRRMQCSGSHNAAGGKVQANRIQLKIKWNHIVEKCEVVYHFMANGERHFQIGIQIKSQHLIGIAGCTNSHTVWKSIICSLYSFWIFDLKIDNFVSTILNKCQTVYICNSKGRIFDICGLYATLCSVFDRFSSRKRHIRTCNGWKMSEATGNAVSNPVDISNMPKRNYVMNR